MKKPTFSKAVIALIALLLGVSSYGQAYQNFGVRYNTTIKGDMLLIGNSNVGIHISNPYNGGSTNNELDAAVFVDIDGDGSTFNSSSADLLVPSIANCYKIKYAGLYWSAVVKGGTPITDVKFKMPGGSYSNITGTTIFSGSTGNGSTPYACYADVTSLVVGLANPQGTYMVGNISSLIGPKPNSEGLSAGWSLFIVYEDPALPSKNITSFDGFSKISSGNPLDVPVSGFKTIPVGPVRAKFAFSAIEGDRKYTGDNLQINGSLLSAVNNAGTTIRPSNNFFNSTISYNNTVTNTPEILTTTNPSSSNTLGFDAGIFSVPNAGNTVIANGDTSAVIRMDSTQDLYYLYFNAFGVEIIEPKIVITKIVQDNAGVDIGNTNVTLGQQLNYVIGFQNKGNDNATSFTIRDRLPINVIFNYPADMGILPTGVTVASYNAATRDIVFNINNSIVEVNDPISVIRFKVQVVPFCNMVSDACSNSIDNSAYATYKGTLNPLFTITDDPSINSNTGCLLTPKATNFLVGIDNCKFTKSEVLCGSSVVLTAANGYSTYAWSKSPFNNGIPTGPIIGTTQSITVSNVGVYYVYDTAIAPCLSIIQEVTVTAFGGTTTNPVIPFADQVVTCPNDGKKLPNIFLCGANAIKNITTGISDGSTIVWEKLNEASCTAITNLDCANESASCTWSQVGTGPDYKASAAGQFRITLNYPGGCFNRYYFNVYQNLLNPTETHNDIICTTSGKITIGGVPAGYEYSMSAAGPWQASNVFTINTAGSYTVYIKQVGVTSNPCIFSVPNIQIRQRNFSVTPVVTQPLCNGDLGNVVLQINDVQPQYYITVKQGATTIFSSGPDVSNSYTFNNVAPGSYDYTITTDDGCSTTLNVVIINPPVLSATSALTKPLTCTDGEIKVTPVGGTPPYFYFVNSTTVFQNTPLITVTNPLPPGGVYNIKVVDNNNCSVTTSITVAATLPPVYTVAKTDVLCSGTNTGTITINVSNPNGNSLRYSINNGVTFMNANVFSALASGNYNVVVEYTTGGEVCLTTPQAVTIAATSPISGSATLTVPYTCSSTATITASATGGVAPYSYSIDGVTFQAGNVFTGLAAGTYTVTVKDVNNCSFAMAPISISSLSGPTGMIVTATDLVCPGYLSHVNLASIGGIPPLRYFIRAAPPTYAGVPAINVSNSDGELKDLPKGMYTFEVVDRNNCSFKLDYYLDPVAPIVITSATPTVIKCFGANTGSLSFSVVGNFTKGNTYSYSVTGPINSSASNQSAPSVTINNLPAGVYTIVVTDKKTTCSDTKIVTITQPASVLTVTSTVTPITCLANGSVVINAVGGWGGYSYTLTPPSGPVVGPQSGNTFANLSAIGTYTITTSDANGCTVSTSFTLVGTTPPTASISVASDLCYDGVNAASIVVNASGGVGTLEYSNNGGAWQTSNTFSNLIPGSYIIKVRDSYGCETTLSAKTIAPQLTTNVVLTKNLDCSASPSALISGTIAGGTAPYVVSIVSGTGTITQPVGLGTSFSFTTATPGAIQFKVTDTNGCTVNSGIITVNPIVKPVITALTQTQQIYCFGESTAAIKVDIDTTKGVGPFIINVFNTTTSTSYGTQTSGLPAGNYEVTVTDAKGCTTVTPSIIIISQPNDIVVDYTVFPIVCDPLGGVSKGKIVINTVTGGSPNYSYIITGTNGYLQTETNNGGSASVTFDIVDFGLYQINIVDQNGCSKVIKDQLVASPPNSLMISVTSPPSNCTTGGSATVAVGSAFAGIGPFYFSLYTGTVLPFPTGTWLSEDALGSKQAVFTNLTPGVTYTYVVYDFLTKCYYFETGAVPIPTNSTLLVNNVIPKNVSCKGSANGTVTFTINSTYPTATPIDYEIFDSLTLVTTGVTGSGIVPVSGALTLTSGSSLSPGNYFVLIKETGTATNSGCSQVSSKFTISESAVVLTVKATILKNENCNQLGQVSVIAQGGTAGYTYQVLPSISAAPVATDLGWVSANTFSLPANSYIAYAKDANGCIQSTAPFTLNKDPEPVVVATISNQCTGTEGTFAIDVALSTAGIAPYSFSIDGGAFQTQNAPFTLSNVSSGTHTIQVKDVNGCGNTATVIIQKALDLTPSITTLPSCANNDGVITVTPSGGSGSYTYSISPAMGVLSGNVFSNLPAGSYTVTITDGTTTCTKSVSVTLDTPTAVVFTASDVVINNISCNGGNNGVVTVVLPASNNNPVYNYTLTPTLPAGPAVTQTSPLFSNLIAGNYTITVTSGRNCSLILPITLTQPPILTVSGTATAFGCAPNNTVNTATITITEAGGNPGYLYSIDGTNYFTTTIFDVIDTGVAQTITVYVKDANGCLATNTVNLIPLPKITAVTAVIATPIDCNNTGSIAINVTGGSGNFGYQLASSLVTQPSNIFAISAPGSYVFQVNDLTTGCYLQTIPFVVAPFNTIDVIATAVTPVTCFGDTNGAISIDVTGYSGSYNYQVFDSLGVAVSGIISGSTAINPLVISGLSGGNYTVQVTETASPFCSIVSNSVTVSSPTEVLSVIATATSNVTCTNNQGTINAIGTGGWGSLQYELVGPINVAYSSNNNFSNLVAGNYSVNVKDSKGCIRASSPVTLSLPSPIVVMALASTPLLSCKGDTNATITITSTTGGQGSNYLYTLNTTSSTPITFSGPQVSPIFAGLGAGVYTITVTDGFKCSTTSLPITISEPTKVTASLIVASTQTCLTQTNLTLTATGGAGPYSYSPDGIVYLPGTFVSSVSFPVSPNTYHYYVKDANGCVSYVSNDVKIDPLSPLTIQLDLSNAIINCRDSNTGVIVAKAQGGLANYVYSLLDGAGVAINPAPMQVTPGVFTLLSAGNYQVKVVSGDCNTTTATITINQPNLPLIAPFIVTDVTCNGNGNGQIVINASGGTGIIKYAISPDLNQFFDTNLFKDLVPGTYNVIVQDVLGCYIPFSFDIKEPSPLMAVTVAGSIIPEYCSGDKDGEFSITINGGTGPYSVSLDKQNGPFAVGLVGQTQFDFKNLIGGSHIVYISDTNNCVTSITVVLPDSVLLNPLAIVKNDCVNNAPGNTVTITIDSSNRPADVVYALDGVLPYQSSNVFTNVAPGSHFVLAHHANSCDDATPVFTVDQIAPLSVVLNDGGLNEIVATTTGGSGVYRYSFNGESTGTKNSYIIYKTGDYTVEVTDSNGCVATATRHFTWVDIDLTNVFTPNNDGNNDTWGPTNTINYPDLVYQIFDRYGRIIATYKEGQFWDGKYIGLELPTGDYWYVLKLKNVKDEREFMGHFTLYR